MRTLFVVAGLAAILSWPAAAQVVHGRVVDAGTGEPAASAAVWLRESSMDDVGPVRTDSAGAFTLRAPRGGVFRLAAGSVVLDPLRVVAPTRRRPGRLDDFRRRAERGRGGCVPAVYLDGMRMAGGAGSIDLWTRPEDLEGIEVYHGATVPVDLSGPGTDCGVVLLWTRTGG